MFLFGHDDVIWRPQLSLYWNNITQEKNCDLPGSIISKLKEINYDLLTAEEWLYFFLQSRIFPKLQLSGNYFVKLVRIFQPKDDKNV